MTNQDIAESKLEKNEELWSLECNLVAHESRPVCG